MESIDNAYRFDKSFIDLINLWCKKNRGKLASTFYAYFDRIKLPFGYIFRSDVSSESEPKYFDRDMYYECVISTFTLRLIRKFLKKFDKDKIDYIEIWSDEDIIREDDYEEHINLLVICINIGDKFEVECFQLSQFHECVKSDN